MENKSNPGKLDPHRMMNWNEFLLTEIEADRNRDLHRECRELPADVLNFGSNDYLGFSTHPKLKEAVSASLADHGLGPRAARLLSGHLDIHEELEHQIAQLKGTEAALGFPNGYATAVGVIPAIVQSGATVVLDEKAHACLWDGARISGAKIRMFEHNDPESLKEVLELERSRPGNHPILIVVESVYSMEGNLAPLQDLIELKRAYDAWLLVDEAHATGVFGSRGQGRIQSKEEIEGVEIQLGTFGKAIGSMGGFAAGSTALIQMLRQRARSFIFTTAAPPLIAAAAIAGIRLLQTPDGVQRRKHLSGLIGRVSNSPRISGPVYSPIVPVPTGNEASTLKLSAELMDQGFYVPAIRFPTVPKGQARLRLSLSAQHREQDLDRLLSLLPEAEVNH